MNINLNEKIDSVISKANSYKEKVFKEESEEEKAKSAIKDLIETDWGKDNDSQGKASEIFKALAFNDSDIANKFMKKINDYTTSLKSEFLKENRLNEIRTVPIQDYWRASSGNYRLPHFHYEFYNSDTMIFADWLLVSSESDVITEWVEENTFNYSESSLIIYARDKYFKKFINKIEKFSKDKYNEDLNYKNIDWHQIVEFVSELTY